MRCLGTGNRHQALKLPAHQRARTIKASRFGLKTRYRPKAKSAAGMARRDDKGVPVIYRFAYAKSPQSLQKFIDRHECAHHQTGDIDRPHPPRNSPDHMMNESIADCIAILRMRDESTDSQAQIKNVTIALRQAMDAVGFPPSTIDSRISNIDNCAQKDTTAAEFIKAVLDHRAAN